jgi:hypothetical protein
MGYNSDEIFEMTEDIHVIEDKVNSLLELTIIIAKKLGVGERQ